MARFCLACGALIAAASSAGLRERKVVSVLFCDLVGFTAASERQDPEDVQRRLQAYHARLRQQIEAFGGTVEKFIGDAVMAVFGAPITHEDDPERAVRAALRIIEVFSESEEGDLVVRIGVNTGEVVVDLGARPERGEGFVTGDVVNTAARIQAAAPAMGVAVGAATYHAVERLFEFERLEAISAKGKREPVVVWQALRSRSRFGSDILRAPDSVFIGREVESALLRALYERSTRDTSVQLVTIVGEPGVGKSRLVSELGEYIDGLSDLVTWRQGRCLPYGEAITFWALGELFKAHAGIYDSDTPEVALGKLNLTLPEGEERDWLRARLAPLLGVDSGVASGREESFAAWRRYLEWITEVGPAVIVVEDIHWADPSLLEFLAYFAEWAAEVPALLVCTARPELYETHPSWAAGIRNATSINLAPLSAAESRELVASLLKRSEFATHTELILERTGGNPLYAEEFVRLLAERALASGAPQEQLRSPASLQALIAARLDTLGPERKALLQDAAVIGKVFWAGAIAEMSGRSAREVELELHDLTRKELVRRARVSSIEGEDEYSFWHGLVCDVAYEQIPRNERARRHAACAAWLFDLAGDGLGDTADIIAHHYKTASELCAADGDEDGAREHGRQARTFLTLAGKRMLSLDLAAAESRFSQALELTSPDDPAYLDVRFLHAVALVEMGDLENANQALAKLIPDLERARSPASHARALGLLSRVARGRGEGRFVGLAEQAVTMLESEPPGPALVDAVGQLAIAQLWTGDTERSTATARQALDLAEQLGLPRPARVLGYLGDATVELGDAAGIALMEEAVELLRNAEGNGPGYGSSFDLVGAINNLALARLPIDGPARALAEFAHAESLARQRGVGESLSIIHLGQSGALFQLGRVSEAIALAQATVSQGVQAGQVWMELIATAQSVRWRTLREGAVPDDFDLGAYLDRLNIDVISDAGPEVFSTAALISRLLGCVGQAGELLARFEANGAARSSMEYPRLLPFLAREAVLVGDVDLAARMREGLKRSHRLHALALDASGAIVAEARGEHQAAATQYQAVARGWQVYGDAPEYAHALHGYARCVRRLGSQDDDAEALASIAFDAINLPPPAAW